MESFKNFELKENQYLPNGLGKPAATYYYIVNDKGQTIDKKTFKPYRGKQMNRYAFKNPVEATKICLKLIQGEL
jgi:hypothetical protein